MKLPKGISVLWVLLVLLATATFLLARAPRPTEPLAEIRNTTEFDFDLNRTPLTRSAVINVCGFRDVVDPGCVTGSNPEDVGGQVPPDRPAIRSTTLVSDLDGSSCARFADEDGLQADDQAIRTGLSRDQLPATQVQASAELTGRSGLKITLVVDPSDPTATPPGTYCSFVLVERDQGAPIPHRIRVTLGNRGHWLPFFTAVAFLVVGAVAGIAVRLANDPIAALVPLRRRQRSITRFISSKADSLGGQRDAIELGLQDVQDAIAMLDVADAKARLDLLQQLVDAASKDPASQSSGELSARVRQNARSSIEPVPGQATIPWIVDRYWVLSTALIVAIVLVTGLTTQYFAPLTLADDIQTWLGLAVFALAFQITATTVAEAVGKLSPSASK